MRSVQQNSEVYSMPLTSQLFMYSLQIMAVLSKWFLYGKIAVITELLLYSIGVYKNEPRRQFVTAI